MTLRLPPYSPKLSETLRAADASTPAEHHCLYIALEYHRLSFGNRNRHPDLSAERLIGFRRDTERREHLALTEKRSFGYKTERGVNAVDSLP